MSWKWLKDLFGGKKEEGQEQTEAPKEQPSQEQPTSENPEQQQ